MLLLHRLGRDKRTVVNQIIHKTIYMYIYVTQSATTMRRIFLPLSNNNTCRPEIITARIPQYLSIQTKGDGE